LAVARPAFREALIKRRGLAPSGAFFKWQRLEGKTKQPFAFALASCEPCAFAGLWESCLGPMSPRTPRRWRASRYFTTNPNELMESVSNRVPLQEFVIIAATAVRLLQQQPRNVSRRSAQRRRRG